jgi:hypothetical protein
MVKDYSDYDIFIYRAGERVYHLDHLRSFNGKNAKGEEYEAIPYELNGHKYQLNLDRAYRIKWAPWKKIMKRLPYKVKIKAEWYFGTVKKGTYAKVPVLVTKTKKPVFSLKVYATLKEFLRAKKIGVIFYQEPCTNECSSCQYKDKDACLGVDGKPIPSLVEPLHVSRIHQPSGEMRG